MVLTIVRKELRETRLFAALAVGLYVIYLCQLTGKGTTILAHTVWWVPGMNVEPPDVPFVQDNFSRMLFFIGAALAIALGFRQSAWEPFQGTALYLLHLPLSRRTIFLTKLLTGIGLLLVCTLLPILIYGVVGRHAGNASRPVRVVDDRAGDSGLADSCRLCIWGRLPAASARRWFGSRLLPLFSVAFTGTLLVPAGALAADRFAPSLACGGGAREQYSLGSRDTRFLRPALHDCETNKAHPAFGPPSTASSSRRDELCLGLLRWARLSRRVSQVFLGRRLRNRRQGRIRDEREHVSLRAR